MKQKEGYISEPIEGNKTQPDGGSYIKPMKVSDIQNKKKWPKTQY